MTYKAPYLLPYRYEVERVIYFSILSYESLTAAMLVLAGQFNVGLQWYSTSNLQTFCCCVHFRENFERLLDDTSFRTELENFRYSHLFIFDIS